MVLNFLFEAQVWKKVLCVALKSGDASPARQIMRFALTMRWISLKTEIVRKLHDVERGKNRLQLSFGAILKMSSQTVLSARRSEEATL
jgi:hypothetical protein